MAAKLAAVRAVTVLNFFILKFNFKVFEIFPNLFMCILLIRLSRQ